MIYQEISFQDYWTWLNRPDSSYSHAFSYEAAEIIFDFMESQSVENESGMTVFDPIAWNCEFSEFRNFTAFLMDAGYSSYDVQSMDDLRARTLVLSEVPLVIADF